MLAAKQAAPDASSSFSLSIGRRGPRSSSPAMTPISIVAVDGMKFRVE